MDEEKREECIFLAKLAEQTERYDEMVTAMDDVVKISKGKLTVEERNLLSVAYKNVIGSKRSSWRVLNSIQAREEAKCSSNSECIKSYLNVIEGELIKLCTNISNLLDEYLINKETSVESKVFYYKMKGDYYRYRAEFAVDVDRQSAAEKSLVAYKEAKTASVELPCTHPICLGLALNFSVFYYEILNNPTKACEMARTASQQAFAELDTLSEESHKDSALILQLLRDNITLWTSGMPGSEEEKEIAASPIGEEN